MNPADFSWIVGKPIKVSFSEPSTWFFAFGESLGISVECPWRLLENGRIVISSDDHRQQFGLPAIVDSVERASSLLDYKAIQRVEVRQGTVDLFIDFDGGIRLEIIPISSGYESWQISTPTGKHIVAQGGGQLFAWQQ